jgi:hypothetical protein
MTHHLDVRRVARAIMRSDRRLDRLRSALQDLSPRGDLPSQTARVLLRGLLRAVPLPSTLTRRQRFVSETVAKSCSTRLRSRGDWRPCK